MAAFEAQRAALHDQAASLRARYEHVHNTDHPDANRVFPIGAGAGFSLADCVDALFRMTIAKPAKVA